MKSRGFMGESTPVNPFEQKNWQHLFSETPGYSFFHGADWADVLWQSYRYKPFYFTEKEDGRVKALLPVMEVSSPITGKRGVSLPFTDYCEPLASDEAGFQEMFAAATTLGRTRNWSYLEIRGGERFLSEKTFSESFYGHTLDLTPDAKDLFSNFRESFRRNIKKAQKEGVRISVSDSLDSVKAFCRLNALTRKKHGLPPQPGRFFQCLYDRVISRGLGIVVTAYSQGGAVAANVYFKSGDRLIYKYGASNDKGRDLKAGAPVMWEAVKWAQDNAFSTLCFGRTETGNEGLRHFKKGFGAKEYRIPYYRYDLTRNEFVKGRKETGTVYKKIFASLPISILNPIGRVLYRHMG
jgi:hypothetical protein